MKSRITSLYKDEAPRSKFWKPSNRFKDGWVMPNTVNHILIKTIRQTDRLINDNQWIVTYMFKGGLPKKWREDDMYFTDEEMEDLQNGITSAGETYCMKDFHP